MEKLSREQIEQIGNTILSESDIIANHGTTINNGLSIMNTGLNFNRTSMIINDGNIIKLCTYGWKETAIGDSSNIIISIPKSFLKSLLGYDDEQYNNWITKIKTSDDKQPVINSVCDTEIISGPFFKSTLPKEFIRGMFIYTDGTNRSSFLNNQEEGMNHLTYIDNKNYYENLTEEEQKSFVSEMRKKMFDEDTPNKTR